MSNDIPKRTLRALARQRSLLAKTVGYRILSVVVTAVVAFAILGDTSTAINVGVWANAAKMGVYYAYERAWSGWDIVSMGNVHD